MFQIIDWNESSLVHIGELKSKSATVLFDVQDSIQVVYSPELEQKVHHRFVSAIQV
jgi:phosphotransferase system IIB component